MADCALCHLADTVFGDDSLRGASAAVASDPDAVCEGGSALRAVPDACESFVYGNSGVSDPAVCALSQAVRLLLPFTYFFFYQYGVISRVYCVMTLAFVLLAIAYRRRNERPGRYVAVLILLCVTMAYGLIMAGGLAIVWLWEIWNEGAQKQGWQERAGVDKRSIQTMVRGYVADRRIWWLVLLLLAALFVVWMIMPRADTFATAQAASGAEKNPF